MRSFVSTLTFLLLCLVSNLQSQDKKEPLFTFGVVADVQYADRDNAGTRYYRSSPEKFREAVNIFNSQRVDFVLSLGDFINDGFQHLDTLTTIAEQLTMPLYHVLGNHDFAIEPHEKEELFATLHINHPYYSFVKKNWRMIVLDGNDISLYANSEGDEKHKQAVVQLDHLREQKAPNARNWNGAIGEKQLAWLENELHVAQNKGEKVVIACHFPLYPDQVSELLWNAKEVRTLIESYPNVIAYLNGHVHKRQYLLENGIQHLTFRGMVEEESNAFSIVSVYEDHLEIWHEANGHGP